MPPGVGGATPGAVVDADRVYASEVIAEIAARNWVPKLFQFVGYEAWNTVGDVNRVAIGGETRSSDGGSNRHVEIEGVQKALQHAHGNISAARCPDDHMWLVLLEDYSR